MNIENIAKIEALLFTAEEPILLKELADAINISKVEAQKCLEIIKKEYAKNSHGFELKEYDESFIFKTKKEMAPYIKELHNASRTVHLSQAALETLAIIAYKQPVTRAEIEEIRGVKAEKTLLTLTKYDLIQELGRKDTIGNPIVYGTTKNFLQYMDITDLSSLPDLNQIKQSD